MPGFKYTTPENWLEPDPLVQVAIRGSDLVRFVNTMTIAKSVPAEVRDAFRFATGAIGYAYYYHPMFTIVSQQVLRVADFAVDKFFELRGLRTVHSFARRLAILKQRGLLTEAEANRWDGIRRLRNSATHPAWQQTWNLRLSLDLIRIVAEAISALPWPKGTRN